MTSYTLIVYVFRLLCYYMVILTVQQLSAGIFECLGNYTISRGEGHAEERHITLYIRLVLRAAAAAACKQNPTMYENIM